MDLIKVAIIGAGQVGGTTAFSIAEKKLADVIVLIDVVKGLAQGKALDILEDGPILGYDTKIIGGDDYNLIRGSRIVIITAGLARTPGMTRLDLLEKNKVIVESVCKNIKKFAPESIVIVVTNPLDIMSLVALKTTEFVPEKVIGMAGILDSSRFMAFIALELSCSVEDIKTFILGSHGDSMVALIEHTTVKGKPITELLDKKKISELVERTRNGGAEIVKYLKTGSAFYAPSAAVALMVEAIIKNKKTVLPCSVYLNGEYGYKDLYLGVPVRLGKEGVEEIIELKLSEQSKKALDRSVQLIKQQLAQLK
jgi:malate dehydrogenase